MKSGNAVLSAYGTTVFERMSQLARRCGAVNLGQGFPEELEPADVVAAGGRAVAEGWNQYAPLPGLPALREAIAAHERRHYGLAFDPEREVVVTAGATEALAASFLALLEDGDEVVLLEPLYDAYLPMVRRAGATPRTVRLRPPEWTLPREELAAAFGPRTKLLVLNTPMNPAGKVFARSELAFLAGLLEQHDAYAVCDEVYEHVLFDGAEHIPLATMPGMRERCLRIASAGKSFSLTGWRIGYVVGGAETIGLVARTHQFINFCVPAGLQEAIAYAFRERTGYFDELVGELTGRRDRFAAALRELGLEPLVCRGGYFLNVDIGALGFAADDAAFCRHITEEAGVAAIPVSAFYRESAPTHLVRFCFAKSRTALEEGAARLSRHFGRSGAG